MAYGETVAKIVFVSQRSSYSYSLFCMDWEQAVTGAAKYYAPDDG